MVSRESIYEALDGNWANDNMGSLEELQETVSLLKETLVICFAALVNSGIMPLGEVKELLSNGCRLREIDDG